MTRLKISTLALSTCFGLAMAGLSMPAAQAGVASSLQNCKGATAGQVISCCNAVIRKSGERPDWYVQAGSRCGSSAAICVGGGAVLSTIGAAAPKSKKHCYFNSVLLSQEGGGELATTHGGTNPNRR